MNYYEQVENLIKNNEVNKKVRALQDNSETLYTYWNVGRLIVEKKKEKMRAKYGDGLIKEWGLKLSEKFGKKYDKSNLSRARMFYLYFPNVATVSQQFYNITWSHYTELLKLKNINQVKYYIYIINSQNLSVRELRERIKSKEYERIGYKEELEKPEVNTLIKNPIIIKVDNPNIKLNEYALHQTILENIPNFLKELGIGFAFIGSEVKIKMGDRYNYIDFLLFNVKYNCYVVIELKVTEMKAEYIGQVTKYINYVDKNIKEPSNDKTVGVIICKKENKFVLEYCTDHRIFTTTYELV